MLAASSLQVNRVYPRPRSFQTTWGDFTRLDYDGTGPLGSTSSKRPLSSESTPGSRKMVYKGSCYCGELKYTIDVSADDARTSLCHCNNCKVLSRVLPDPKTIILFFSQSSRSDSTLEVFRYSFWLDNQSPCFVVLLRLR